MLELGKKMVSMCLQWAEGEGRCLSLPDATILQGIFSTILAKMKVRGRGKVVDMKLMSQAMERRPIQPEVGRGGGYRGSSLSKKYEN